MANISEEQIKVLLGYTREQQNCSECVYMIATEQLSTKDMWKRQCGFVEDCLFTVDKWSRCNNFLKAR